jgi:protein TonB
MLLSANHLSFHQIKPVSNQKTLTALAIVIAHLVLGYCLILQQFQRPERPLITETVISIIAPPQSEPERSLPAPSKTTSLPQIQPIEYPIPPSVESIQVRETVETPAPVAPTKTPVVVAALSAPAHAEPSIPIVTTGIEYIQAPQAMYPPISKRMGEEGRIVLQVLVNEKGLPEKIEIMSSSGFARLDEAAKKAMSKALFKPFQKNGQASAMLATASISFSLNG